MNSLPHKKEDIKPEIKCEAFLPSTNCLTPDEWHGNTIKQEYCPDELHNYVKQEFVDVEPSKLKSEAPDRESVNIPVKLRLINEEVHIKAETNVGIPTTSKILQCTLCNFNTVWKSNFRNHKKTHTGEKPHQCNTCDYKCIQRSSLLRHMRKHSGEKPYRCDICDSTFTQTSSLQIHMKTHTGVKPYKCSVCDYRCLRKCYLPQHMLTHTGEKPFKCNVCDYKSFWKGDLRKHMKTHQETRV